MTIFAFDFGTKKIGVAIGQTVTKTARPLVTLAAKSGQPDWTVLDKLINKWRPNALIIGMPYNMDGTKQLITEKAYEFLEQLKARYHLKIYEVDERLTTKAAREQLFNEGGYKALQDGQVDRVAAQLILETWFMTHHSELNK